MVDVETKTNIKIRRKEQMEKTTMSVQELSAQMGISLPKAYELVKSPGFPTIRLGTRILIPVDAYKEWLLKDSVHR
jgi:excisionase family DNA binding protein